jgi:hypothetical protein
MRPVSFDMIELSSWRDFDDTSCLLQILQRRARRGEGSHLKYQRWLVGLSWLLTGGLALTKAVLHLTIIHISSNCLVSVILAKCMFAAIACTFNRYFTIIYISLYLPCFGHKLAQAGLITWGKICMHVQKALTNPVLPVSVHRVLLVALICVLITVYSFICSLSYTVSTKRLFHRIREYQI